MEFRDFTSLTNSSIFTRLQTNSKGLTEEEALRRLKQYGENRIASREVTSWQILVRQLKSPFVYLLFISFLISFLLGEKLDALMILLFVTINTGLGFYQEYRSEKAVKLLRKYLVAKIKVRRDGFEKNIETQFLVPGDIVLLEPGDIIPGDVRFVETTNLSVDESVLTGESQPVTKFSDPVKGVVAQIYQAENIGFAGTTVVSGKGVAVVFATGPKTNYAKIVELTSESERESTFEKELSRFSKFTLVVVMATLVFVVVTSVAIKPNPSLVELSLFAIALAVSVIPEALPLVTTFSLSIGAIDLAKKNVVVKRLSSIEDLGALEILCCDKTGTLTENKLTVVEVLADDPENCIFKANLASGDPALSRNIQNNAFDIALAKKLDKKAKDKLGSFKKIVEIPFDPGRRRITTLISDGKNNLLVTRGSPEEILAVCDLVSLERKKLLEKVNEIGRKGRRVLAVAEKKIPKNSEGALSQSALVADLERFERGLSFLGLIVFSDPIKPSAYSAVASAQKLGVRVKILTGDSAEVAKSVAQKIGLIAKEEEVITGRKFESLDVLAKHEAVEEYGVFARVTPEQKYEIIKLLQEKYSVGFLGEGINDAPALKIADVAIAVQGAADVAREASDVVLLKRDLKVILDGIEGGRSVFENTSKYITATMASNFGNFFAVSVVAPFLKFLPMLPLQILLVNLLSDFPMIMVATDNVDTDLIRHPKRYSLKSFATKAFSFGALSTAFDFVTFTLFLPLGEGLLQTYWFIESILTELLFLFAIRTTKPFWKTKAPSPPLFYLTLFTIFITVILPSTKLGKEVFKFVQPSPSGLLAVFAIVSIYLFSNEVVKFVLRKVKGL